MKKNILNTIDKIKQENITPEAKSFFLLRKYGKWVLFFLTAALAGVSVSAALYVMGNLDWDPAVFFRTNLLGHIPYFWIVLIALFAIIAAVEIRRTENGYRYTFLKILLIALVSIFFFGIFLGIMGAGRKIDNAMLADMPMYAGMNMAKQSQWNQPDRGLLSGTIISVSNNTISIVDFSGKKWDISVTKDTLVRPAAVIANGQQIKIIGKKSGDTIFTADEIRPWGASGMGRGGMNGEMGRGMMR